MRQNEEYLFLGCNFGPLLSNATETEQGVHLQHQAALTH